MDNLIEYFEAESRNLDDTTQQVISPSKMATAANQYVSCIRFNGIPILPPVLTAKRKEEMSTYKYQAKLAEKKLKGRQREKLMARAQRVVQNTKVPQPTYDSKSQDRKVLDIQQQLEEVQTLTETGQFDEAIQSIDSLSSGLISLEDGSLPKDFYGLPCTSVHEQQISQVLQKLSKQLNLKDTLSSTGGSEAVEENTNLKMQDKKIPDSASERSFRDSQDTVVEVLNTVKKRKPPAITIEGHDHNSSVKDSPSAGYGSGDSSANTSASDRIKGSPKSLKNTVHFSEFVKVLNTNQSVEDKITVKRLAETKPFLDQSNQNQKSKPTETKDSPKTNQTQSLLSKVILSPENEVTTPSPDDILEVPFLSKQISSDKSSKKNPESQVQLPVPPGGRKYEISDKPPKPYTSSSPQISPSCGSDPGTSSVKRSVPAQRSSSLRYNRSRKLNFSENSQNISTQSSHQSFNSNQSSPSNNLSTSQTTDSTNSRLSSNTSVSQTSNNHNTILSSTQTTTNSNTRSSSNSSVSQMTDSSNTRTSQTSSSQSAGHMSDGTKEDTGALSSSHDTNSTVQTRQSNDTNSHFTSVTDSQISARTNFTLETTDSESTIKADGNVGSSTGSSNLLRYKKVIENTLRNSDSDVSRSQIDSVTESLNCDTKVVNSTQNDLSEGKGHQRRGSYTLDNPSPVLIQAQSRIDQNGGGMLGVETSIYGPVVAGAGIGKSIQRKLDYDDDLELENTRPLTLPIPPGPGVEGKVEHINRYLNHVAQQKQSQIEQSELDQPTLYTQSSELDEYSTMNSIKILHSLMEEINNKPNMSEDEMLTLQREQFQLMHKQLMEQQRNDLEELFVQQRREQIHLQSEIDTHQEQQKKMNHSGKKVKPVYDSPKQDIINNSLISYSSASNQLGHQNHSIDKSTPKHIIFPKTSTPTPKVYKPLVRSPVKSVDPVYRPKQPVKLPPNINDIETQLKFFKLTALAKGFLTRRLLHSEKVQELIKTIRDTREFALSFQSETPIKQGTFSNQDRNLLERIIAQLQAALLDIHEIFFILPISDRLELIRQTRQKEYEKRYLRNSSTLRDSTRKVSSATLKAIERKQKAQEDEAYGTTRPKTAPPSTSSPRTQSVDVRALKPLQGVISPIRSDGGSHTTTRIQARERPKTAPERNTKEQIASKNRKINNAAPTTVKPNKTPASNSKTTKILRKISSKGDKVWR